jgi:NADH:ubiquinone oxidoreductase subunit F (NADH-binding)
MLNILARLLNNEGRSEDLDQLRRLCGTVGKTSLCGLGQTAPNPILTTLSYFEDEYLALIESREK